WRPPQIWQIGRYSLVPVRLLVNFGSSTRNLRIFRIAFTGPWYHDRARIGSSPARFKGKFPPDEGSPITAFSALDLEFWRRPQSGPATTGGLGQPWFTGCLGYNRNKYRRL